VLAVDLNAGHLAAVVVDPSGNPLRGPATIPLALGGLAASTRDGHLRRSISQLLQMARAHDCRALVIEDLDFCDSREQGRERPGRRPTRGRRGKSFRRLVAGIPTARFRDRLRQMSTNKGLAVVAVDPAYTSSWVASTGSAP
jgi:IS605 OrfB family transposase